MFHESTVAKPSLNGSSTKLRPADSKQDCVAYRHILIPTSLEPGESDAVRVGLQLAAAHQAEVTVLHVLSPSLPPSSVNWMDAIDNLWEGLSRPAGSHLANREAATVLEGAHQEVCQFLLREGNLAVQDSPHVRVECRFGDIASEILRYSELATVDAVILCCKLPTSWATWTSRRVLHVLQSIQKQVVLVRPSNQPSRQ